MKTGTKSGKPKTKKIIISLIIIFAFVGIIALGLYQSLSQSQTRPSKKPAAEYFEIFEATVNDGEFEMPSVDQGGSYENSSILFIFSISYKIRAIGGDAHNVVIKSWAKADLVDFQVIQKDQWEYVEQTSSRPLYGYKSTKDSTGKFPFQAKIVSDEAEGTILIYM
jgi:hypothetical protein